MAKPTKKIMKRFQTGMKTYQKIFSDALSHDIAEADTVAIIRDFISDVLGYDKLTEITSEQAIRGTYCDIAIKNASDDRINFLIEVKRIGEELNIRHLNQAEGYAAKYGLKWVILTNGRIWEVYKMSFGTRIDSEKIFMMDLIKSDLNQEQLYEMLFALSKEGLEKSAMDEYHALYQALNKYSITAMLLSEPIIKTIKRELRKCHEGIKVDEKRIEEILRSSIIKGTVIDSENLKTEILTYKRRMKALERKKSKQTTPDQSQAPSSSPTSTLPPAQL